MNAKMTPKNKFKGVCIGGHLLLMMQIAAMASSHATIEMININLFIILYYKRYVVLLTCEASNRQA